MSIKFIHTSDWQLGMTRAFLSQEAAARFSQARIDVIRDIGAIAEEEAAQFVVVAGDVFESNQLSAETVGRTVDALNAISVPVFLLPGNHDPYDAASVFRSAVFKASVGDHIQVLLDGEAVPVPGVSAIEVIGAPWFTKRPDADLCERALQDLDARVGHPRILVAHGQVDTLAPDKAQPGVIATTKLEAALREGRIQYVALGDRHSVTSVGESGRIWYSGAPLATDFDEVNPNHVLVVSVDSERVNAEARRVGDWQFKAADFAINGHDDLDRMKRWLNGFERKERAVIKVGLTGSVSLALAAEIDTLMVEQAQRFASLRLRERTSDLVVVPDSVDREPLALQGYFASAWDQLAESSDSDTTARDALRLLYRLAASRVSQ